MTVRGQKIENRFFILYSGIFLFFCFSVYKTGKIMYNIIVNYNYIFYNRGANYVFFRKYIQIQ